jgi:hypothetical protein
MMTMMMMMKTKKTVSTRLIGKVDVEVCMGSLQCPVSTVGNDKLCHTNTGLLKMIVEVLTTCHTQYA